MSKTNTNQKTEVQNDQPPHAKYQKELDQLTTVSAKIRFLDSKDLTRSQIATALGKRYQHVRNVLVAPVPKKS